MTTLAGPPPKPKLMSIDEFMAMPDSVGFELVEGVLTERKLMGALADFVAMQIVIRLGSFCSAARAGYVFGSETTYRCFGHPNTGRRPDLSYVRIGRFPGERIPEGYVDIAADLAVEVISPGDLAYEIEEKVKLYLDHGFGEVWVVYPNTRTVHVHRRGQPSLTFGDSETLTGRGPLQGFASPVADIFPAPPAAEQA